MNVCGLGTSFDMVAGTHAYPGFHGTVSLAPLRVLLVVFCAGVQSIEFLRGRNVEINQKIFLSFIFSKGYCVAFHGFEGSSLPIYINLLLKVISSIPSKTLAS